tara:strand:+ start:311 stop:1228 length:918 start_codon:yes stop_codon:yes gene_type:complete
MKILITGAAGFLGSHLCDELLASNYTILGIDNFFRGKKENLPTHKNFNFIKCNLKNKPLTKKIFNKFNPDIVIHYAAINGTRYFYDMPHRVCNDNIIITQNVLEACNKKVKKIIYASSSEVYGPSPITPTKESEPIILHPIADRDSYASSKAIGEFLVKLWAKENNKQFLIVRPFNTYGPRMATNGYGQVIPEFIERIQSKEDFFMYGDGSQTRSFCYVKDHTKILKNLIKINTNEILNVGFDEEITIFNLSKKIHQLMGREYKISYKPAWSNDTKWRKPDLSKIKKLLPNFNFTSLEKGLKNII